MRNALVMTFRWCFKCGKTTEHKRGGELPDWTCQEYGHPKAPTCCYQHQTQGGECDGTATNPLPSVTPAKEGHHNPRV